MSSYYLLLDVHSFPKNYWRLCALKDESRKNTINLTELEQSLSCPDTQINTTGLVELDIWTFSPWLFARLVSQVPMVTNGGAHKFNKNDNNWRHKHFEPQRVDVVVPSISILGLDNLSAFARAHSLKVT